mmetsp:Transcript_39134/g.45652  ORF Transcript_39134/g.45652 Transcript_39134/m.45652 type:complete len:204 (-) Transcript_39134:295-906(-)|eukprot:CAMPEP_0194358248 /NCGR_PEP_ID=MMETSP0174-20130528/5523_1 /TAXON_ID=216777 /ORGANISM="Proboscia alata, Strain PI-D3" /LENGTH=203 /DNA_ID=CAMNT_0039128507 /DNA_START=69 /DNA_END=680 /DNA_ORIENTATION=+
MTFSYTPIPPIIALLLFFIASPSIAAPTVISTTFSEQECHSWGFDPTQLSCETCDLIKQSSAPKDDRRLRHGQCIKCCQSWLPSSSSTPVKHTAALFVVGEQMMQQMSKGDIRDYFFAEDENEEEDPRSYEKLMSAKSINTVIKNQNFVNPRTEPSIYFSSIFGKDVHNDVVAARILQDPDDIINISDWSKDDIRDMLWNSLS